MDGPTTVPGTARLEVGHSFDLEASVHSGQSHRWRRDGHGAEWHWGIVYDNLVKIRSTRLGPSAAVCLEFSPAIAGGHDLAPQIGRFFRLDDDIESIRTDISRDPRVAEMVGLYPGLRLLRVDPWECMVSFICSANSNLARIHANVESIAEAYGRRLVVDGHVRFTLPGPPELAQVGERRLRGLGLGFRAPYVAAAATAVAEGALDLEALRRMAYPEAHERLMELPGIGPKIADCILLHSLDQLEAFPVDVWVRRALREWYFDGRKSPPDGKMAAWARDHFGRWAGYAELYLFHGRRLMGRPRPG
ncbi:MAG: hypothetical protein J4F43_04910 [Dehalococcoidia bacterium]|nr:hypothetical protein [Dehalococcoidia bacterium]